MSGRYVTHELDAFAQQVIADGFCILPGHFAAATLARWNEQFLPLLHGHIAREGHLKNRGPCRYYVTLPFVPPWADRTLYEDDDVLAIVERLVDRDPVMVQLATDTPLRGSEHQELHRDAPPLFPETGCETPPFQLAVNFALVDVTRANGPFEITRGTHMLPKDEALRRIDAGEIPLEPLLMKLGDVIIRDVRGIHRGTPNETDEPRPMVVIGYSRKWLFRPEVSIQIPRATYATLSERARHLLRFNPVVDTLDTAAETEIYQAYQY
jgi:hypothetical protein